MWKVSDEDAPQDYRQLTLENETSVNVNWNYGGTTRGPQDSDIEDQIYLDGMNGREAGRWTFCQNAPDEDDGQANLVGRDRNANSTTLRWSHLYPSGSVDTKTFNMVKEMKTLAGEPFPSIFRDVAHVLEFYDIDTDDRFRLGDHNLETYKGTIVYQWDRVTEGQAGYSARRAEANIAQRRAAASQRQLWLPSPRLVRIMMELEIPQGGGPRRQFDRFVERYAYFALESGGGLRDRQVDYNKGPHHGGYGGTLHAVFKEFRRTGMTDARITELAEAALTVDEKRVLVQATPPIKYDFFDFETETGFVADPFTDVLLASPAARRRQLGEFGIVGNLPYNDSIKNAVDNFGIAKGTAEYVYTLANYERAIEDLPEAVLPNLYVYQLAHGQSQDVNMGERGWDSSPESRDLHRGYDRRIRLGEFVTGTLPGLRAGTQFSEERGSPLTEYLESYADAVKNKDVIIDVVSELAKGSVENGVGSEDIEIYEKFNDLRFNFPMFTELSIPMISQGDLGSIIEDLPPTTLINSILRTSDAEYAFKISSYGVSAMEGTERLGNEEDDKRRREPTIVRMVEDLKVISGSRWFNNLRQGLRPFNSGASINTLQFRPTEGIETAQAFVDSLENEVNDEAESRVLMYRDFLTGEKSLCDSETIMFKLVKKDPALPEGQQVLQNYFFPNTDLSSINFVDTQVKYGKYYQYELYAYDVVYGSTFEFRTRAAIYPEGPASENELAFFSFNVDTKPKPVIVEYPLISSLWRRQTEDLTLGTLASAGTRPDQIIGGVNYPPLRIQDYPPLPPEVSMFSYKGTNNKLLMNLSPGVGEYLEKDALPWISFDDDEESVLQDLSDSQRQANPKVPANKIEYRETKGPVKMLIYRTDKIKTNVARPENLYESFSGKLHKTLDLSEEATVADTARAYDFLDDLEPNKKYYYTFRTMNYRDQISNPTTIYEVELVSDKGFNTAYIQEYSPPVTTEKMPTKKLIRYLEVKAAEIQSLPFQEMSQMEGYVNSRTGYFSSKRSLINNDGQTGVVSNKFIVRLTSRDTGRKIDIAIDFKRSEKTIN